MPELTANVNWIAVVVGFVAAFGLGYLWFGPLFGKRWADGLKISLPEKPPVAALAVQALGTFGLAWLFGITAGANALAAIVLVVATLVAFGVAGNRFGQRPTSVTVVEAGYVAAMAVVMFAAQAIL